MATHLTEGNIEYYFCSTCDEYFSDSAGYNVITFESTKIPKTTAHTANSTEWSFDEANHWHECDCGEIIDTAQHTFEVITDREALEFQTGLQHEECTVCGYEKEAEEIPATNSTFNFLDGAIHKLFGFIEQLLSIIFYMSGK